MAYGGAFQRGLTLRIRQPAVGRDFVGGGREQRHPLADEVARRQGLRLRMQRCANAAAAPVTEHDDVPNPQALHGELQSGRGTLVSTVRLIGRHQVGDIADDEELTWQRIENRFGRRPGIAAGDDHDLGRLPVLRERAVTSLLPGIAVILERAIAIQEESREVGHRSPSLSFRAARPAAQTRSRPIRHGSVGSASVSASIPDRRSGALAPR